MKKYKFLLVFTALFLMLFTACGEAQIETLTSSNPKGDINMTITGSKNSPMAPIMVSFLVEVAKGEVLFMTELHNNKLTDETCKVTWDDDNSGIVTMLMADGEEKILDFVATEDTIHFINRFYN